LPLFSGQADLFSQFCCLSQVVESPLLLSLPYGQERFGLTDRGRITAGARADLLLIDGNPMTNIAGPLVHPRGMAARCLTYHPLTQRPTANKL
jgi:cytosine/adenosine deaminase-related metal-dependent hydrolase